MLAKPDITSAGGSAGIAMAFLSSMKSTKSLVCTPHLAKRLSAVSDTACTTKVTPFSVLIVGQACLPVAGINSREDVLKMGIDKYNEECRSIVMR